MQRLKWEAEAERRARTDEPKVLTDGAGRKDFSAVSGGVGRWTRTGKSCLRLETRPWPAKDFGRLSPIRKRINEEPRPSRPDEEKLEALDSRDCCDPSRKESRSKVRGCPLPGPRKEGSAVQSL